MSISIFFILYFLSSVHSQILIASEQQAMNELRAAWDAGGVWNTADACGMLLIFVLIQKYY